MPSTLGVLLKQTCASLLIAGVSGRLATWAVSIITLSVLLSIQMPIYSFALGGMIGCILIALFCLVALRARCQSSVRNVLLILCYSISIAVYGLYAWFTTHPSQPTGCSATHLFPCLGSALFIFWSRFVSVPVKFQVVPILGTIFVPIATHPDYFSTPIPCTFLFVALICTPFAPPSKASVTSSAGLCDTHSCPRPSSDAASTAPSVSHHPLIRRPPMAPILPNTRNSMDTTRDPFSPSDRRPQPSSSRVFLLESSSSTALVGTASNPLVHALPPSSPRPDLDVSASLASMTSPLAHPRHSPAVPSNSSFQNPLLHSGPFVNRPNSASPSFQEKGNTSYHEIKSPASAEPPVPVVDHPISTTSVWLRDEDPQLPVSSPTLEYPPWLRPVRPGSQPHMHISLSSDQCRPAEEKAIECGNPICGLLRVRYNELMQKCASLEQIVATIEMQFKLNRSSAESLRGRLDAMQRAKSKVEDELRDLSKIASETRMKYDELVDRCEALSVEKAKTEQRLEVEGRELREMKTKYGLLNVRFEQPSQNGIENQEMVDIRPSEKSDDECRPPQKFPGATSSAADAAKLQQPRHPSGPNGRDTSRSVPKTHSIMGPVQNVLETEVHNRLVEAQSMLLQSLKTGGMSVAEHIGITQKAFGSLQVAVATVGDLIEFCQPISDPSELKPSESRGGSRVVIRRFAISILRSLEMLARQTFVELLLDVDPMVPTAILINQQSLKRILNSLLINALTSAPNNSRVLLRLAWDSDRGYIQVAIKNEALGFSEDQLAKVSAALIGSQGFDSAFTLGLCASQRILGKIGGSLSVSSPGSRGGCVVKFEVKAPLVSDVRSPVETAVLLIDPDPVRSQATTRILQYAGVHVLDSPSSLVSPAIVFLTSVGSDWSRRIQEVKNSVADQSSICLVVPNNVSINAAAEKARVDTVLRSPVDVAELRSILTKLADFSNSDHSSTASQDCKDISRPSLDSEKIVVLVAEDNDINFKLFTRQLLDLGISAVHRAHDGSEALHLAQNNRYAAILIEYQLPIMSGLEAVRKIRQTCPHHSKTPIWALTVGQIDEIAQRCVASGVTDVIAKPIPASSWQEIVRTTARHFRRSTTNDSLLEKLV